ncbi:MAG: hypothetical protein ACP6IP_08930 [Candidatus Njordarchaeia archaeon]
MSTWSELISMKDNLIGEIANVDGDILDIFVYPDKFNLVAVGSIIIVETENVKPLGIVLKKAHKAKYNSFTPLKKSRGELAEAYPDLEAYHDFVTTVVYTSVLRDDEIKHFRGPLPKLHDLVYIVRSENLLESFFKPGGNWDFSFLEYYLASGATHLEIREMFYNNLNFFSTKKLEKQEIIASLAKYVSRFNYNTLEFVLEDLEAFFNGI